MFSTVSRKLKGKTKTGAPIQLFTPAEFDNFLSSKVFQDPVPVKRIHVVPDMGGFFDSSKNPHTKGIGHQGWRPGQILKSQRVRMLERLKVEDLDLYNQMLRTNSLVIPDATASFALEDFDVLRAQCQGHDGKNPNHVIRFAWCPLKSACIVQYKHFCFDDGWRPTLLFNRQSGRWETNANVTYSWFKETADLADLAGKVATPKKIYSDPIDQGIFDNISKCVGSMANFSAAILEEWSNYFATLEQIRRQPKCDIPVLSVQQIAEQFANGQTDHGASKSCGLERFEKSLRLTSIVHANDRETLVALGAASARAWSNDMLDTRATQRIRRQLQKEREGIWIQFENIKA